MERTWKLFIYLSIYLDLLDWDETGNEWEMDAIDVVSFALSTERFVQRDVSCAMNGRKRFSDFQDCENWDARRHRDIITKELLRSESMR